jgi:hypothetical protein
MKSLKQLIHFVDINKMETISLNKERIPISQEIKLNIKEKFSSKIEKLLENYISEDESAPYGNTYVCSGYFYSEEVVEKCMELAKEELIEKFKEDPEEFLSATTGDYDFIEVLNFINQL